MIASRPIAPARRVRALHLRRWIEFVQETTSIFFREDTCKAPGFILEGLYVHDLDQQEVPWLGALDFKGTRQVVNPGQVDVPDVICAVIVAYLAAGPVQAFDLDRLPILNLASKGNYPRMAMSVIQV